MKSQTGRPSDLSKQQTGGGSNLRSEEDNRRLALVSTAIIIILATVSARSVNNMVSTSLPFLAKYTFSFSNVLVGVLSSALNISTFTVTSFINPHLKSRTRRKAFIASTGILPVTLFLFYTSSPISLWPISILSGLAIGLIFPNIITSATLHRDHMVQMRLLAIYSLSLSLSLVMGPSIETWLLTFLSYRQIFLPFMAISIIGFAVSPLIKFPDVKREVSGRKALGNRGLHTSILSITVYNVPFAAITSFLVIFAVEKFSVTSSSAYSIFIYFFLTSFISRLTMAIRPFTSLFLPMFISAIITIIGMSLIPFMNSFLYFVVIMALLGIPHGTIFPMSSMLIARGTTPEERNVANSYFMAYNNSLFIIVPVIFGYLSITAGFTISFLAISVTAVVSTILMVLSYLRNKDLFSRHQIKIPPR